MEFTRLVWIALLAAAGLARAAYAPVPSTELGKDWKIEVPASIYYDSNIFGASSGAISSNIFSISPKIGYEGSLTDQAFLSGSYKLALDHFDNRPGDKTLTSHELAARLAYAFSKTTTLDLSDTFVIQKNPEALLPGVATPASSEQSFRRNELNGTFATAAGPKVNLTFKARTVYVEYDAVRLGADLDRTENIYGISADYAYQPEIKIVGEYRRQDIDYDQSGGTKNKTSDFLLAGADYNFAKEVIATGRLGGEQRRREGEDKSTSPYAEATLRYDYAEKSYLSAGYVLTYEEASNVALYTDTLVNRFFINVQHALSGPLSASASLNYEPSELQGRRGLADIEERTFRMGLAGFYAPTQNWLYSVNYDYDKVSSDDASRKYTRHRFGVSARFTF